MPQHGYQTEEFPDCRSSGGTIPEMKVIRKRVLQVTGRKMATVKRVGRSTPADASQYVAIRAIYALLVYGLVTSGAVQYETLLDTCRRTIYCGLFADNTLYERDFPYVATAKEGLLEFVSFFEENHPSGYELRKRSHQVEYQTLNPHNR